jgi:hypothetical protein
VFTVYALNAHLTYGQLITKIAPDVVGATSIVGNSACRCAELVIVPGYWGRDPGRGVRP